MTKQNVIRKISFPDTPEIGLEVVIGSRVDEYVAAHPEASPAESYAAAMASMRSAATPLRIDAVVGGVERRLNVIAALPTNEQMAMGNHALELSFVTLDDDLPIAFGDRAISEWVEDCSEEVFQAVFSYFESQIDRPS